MYHVPVDIYYLVIVVTVVVGSHLVLQCKGYVANNSAPVSIHCY